MIFILCSIFLLSCENNQDDNINETNHKRNGVASSNEVHEELLFNGETNYSKALYNYPMIGYFSDKNNSLKEEILVVCDGSERNPLTKSSLTKSSSNIKVLINGKDIKNLTMATKANNHNVFSDLYGKEVSFTLSSVMTKGQNNEKTVSMYVPELVEITSPKIETEEELYPYCYYKDFVIQWKPDMKNENGLVVAVEWYGLFINGEKENKHVRNIDVLMEDDGEEILKNTLFNDIPEQALCYIILLRGNIENIDFEDSPYSIVGETHAVLPLILIRNLKE